MARPMFLGVPCWKTGYKNQFNRHGVDESVWEENASKPYDIRDYTVWLYLMEDTLNSDIFKFGISSNSYFRAKQLNINCKSAHANHKFKVVDEIFMGDRATAEAFEAAILNSFKDYKVYRRGIFGGATELVRINKQTAIKCFQSLRLKSR